MTMLGYARVSTRGQDPGPQVEALTAAGCSRVWVETASGYHDSRPQLGDLCDYARAGDVLVVVGLDRLGRSVQHLLQVAVVLQDAEIGLKSLRDAIDTTTATGQLFFTIAAAFAEFEGRIRRERQELAWAGGKRRGRPPSMTPEQVALARQLRDQDGRSLAEIARSVGVTKSTVHRALAS